MTNLFNIEIISVSKSLCNRCRSSESAFKSLVIDDFFSITLFVLYNPMASWHCFYTRVFSWDVFLNQGSHRHWKSWKMKMVMEKSWNMKNWQKVLEFYDQSLDLNSFALEFYQIYASFADITKLSISLDSPHFPTFSAKCRECKI